MSCLPAWCIAAVGIPMVFEVAANAMITISYVEVQLLISSKSQKIFYIQLLIVHWDRLSMR